MQANDYIQECLKTEARDFTPVQERLKDPALMAFTLQILKSIMEDSNVVDAAKKNIFYGKEVEGVAEAKSQALKTIIENGIDGIVQDAQKNIYSDIKNVRIMHSIIGIASEVGELIECFMTAMVEGKPVDEVNLKEEFGDLFWYSAIGLNAINSSYEEAWKLNVVKLAKRYAGQKFSEGQAISRADKVEQSTLEGSQL